jgi:uroporphyrinogen-III decarboxylase
MVIKMTGLERTICFLRGEKTDHPPFHPIIMRWAAKYAGVKYRDFCTVPAAKTHSTIMCATDFDMDWVTVLSDPWAEASAFGIKVEYPVDNLPLVTSSQFPDALSVSKIRKYNPADNMRCSNRIEEIKIYSRDAHDKFIVGWIEGPVAEYVDLRGASNAAIDFLIEPEAVAKAMDVIMESAFDFIRLQIKAGAHCIGIGDAFCSQIGPELYLKYAFERQRKLVECIHNYGALAKLHICGDTTELVRDMIRTGADIIDIDHLVKDMSSFSSYLEKHQVLSGKCDPVTVIENGDDDTIFKIVEKDFNDAGGRCIISAGCEITPGTTIGKMKTFKSAADLLA